MRTDRRHGWAYPDCFYLQRGSKLGLIYNVNIFLSLTFVLTKFSIVLHTFDWFILLPKMIVVWLKLHSIIRIKLFAYLRTRPIRPKLILVGIWSFPRKVIRSSHVLLEVHFSQTIKVLYSGLSTELILCCEGKLHWFGLEYKTLISNCTKIRY